MKLKVLLILLTLIGGTGLHAQTYWNTTPKVGSDGVMEIGKYIDFHETSADTKDYSPRLSAVQGVLTSSGSMKIHGNLNVNSLTTAQMQVNGSIRGSSMVLDNPNRIGDWNMLWQSGFMESYNATNAPESGWFWGANFNHSSNNADYRYNGQIAIKHSPTTPVMYFRSTNVNGEGTWTKLLHAKGNQHIEGTLGIGTSKTDGYTLSVGGKIRADEVKVYTGWADFVFDDDYVLRPLADVEQFIKEKGHLPDVPSEAEVLENGIEVGAMNATLLQKIEELTLYMIEMKKENESLKSRISTLEAKNK